MSSLYHPSRFRWAGVAGLALALLLTLLGVALVPRAVSLALLSVDVAGTRLVPLGFLLALGGIAVAELPLVLVAMVHLARRALPEPLLLALHASYTAFPAFYGLLGALLTGERWWLWLMLFLSVARLATSLVGVRPAELAARAARPSASSPAPLPSTRPAGLDAVRGFLLDMDGVLFRGNTPREGAAAFIAYLNEQGIPYLCLTNNARRTSEMAAAALAAMGLPIPAAHILGSAQATAEWLAARATPGARVLPIGEAGLRDELARAGFALVEAAPAEWVVVGLDFQLTYEKLKQAALAVRRNAGFVGTNPDTTLPTEEGLVPGNGSTLAFLEAATGVKPTIIGKPSPAIMEVALAHLGLPRAQVAMVGDRLDTDIRGGQNAGLATIFLRGGVSSDADLAAFAPAPDHTFDDLGALLAAYRPDDEPRG